MKFAALAVLFAAAVAEAALPAGFIEQCCVKYAQTEGDRKRDRRLDGDALKHLSGYDYKTGIIDDICLGKVPAETDSFYWKCYTYKEVCENADDMFAGGKIGAVATTEICNNNANCYNPKVTDASCGTVPAGQKAMAFYPDIWWSCKTAPGTGSDLGKTILGYKFCGFQCKFENADACGDPHFRTWAEEWYDFHGECDLVLVTAPEFGLGLGLDVHVRTKARYEYSFIESAAVKIGDDVLEVSSYGEYSFNGVDSADLSHAKFADLYNIEHNVVDAQNSNFVIRTGGNEKITVKAFKDLVSVHFSNATMYNFESAHGMMGDFLEGKLIARDGKTEIATADEYGLEWQVKAGEPQLFKVARDPNQKCLMPADRVVEKRRLGANAIERDAAEAACAGVDSDKFENCVYDVIALQDVDMAKQYA